MDENILARTPKSIHRPASLFFTTPSPTLFQPYQNPTTTSCSCACFILTKEKSIDVGVPVRADLGNCTLQLGWNTFIRLSSTPGKTGRTRSYLHRIMMGGFYIQYLEGMLSSGRSFHLAFESHSRSVLQMPSRCNLGHHFYMNVQRGVIP